MGWLERKDIFRFFLFPRVPSVVYVFNLEEGRRSGNQVYGVSWRDPATIVSIPVKLKGLEQDVIELLHFTIDRGDKETEEDVVVLGNVRTFTNASINEVPVGGEFSILRPFLLYFMLPWLMISYWALLMLSSGAVSGGLGYFLLGLSFFFVFYPLVVFSIYSSSRPIRYVELLPVGVITGRNVIEVDGELITTEGEGVTIYTPSPNQVGMSLFKRRLGYGDIVLKSNEAVLITKAGVKFVEAEMWKQKARAFAMAALEGEQLLTPQQYVESLNRLSSSRLRRVAVPLAIAIMAVTIAVLVFMLLQPTVAPAPVENATTAVHAVTTFTATTEEPNVTVF
jgi:hypothetical protein